MESKEAIQGMQRLQIKDGVVRGADKEQAFTKDALIYMVSDASNLSVS